MNAQVEPDLRAGLRGIAWFLAPSALSVAGWKTGAPAGQDVPVGPSLATRLIDSIGLRHAGGLVRYVAGPRSKVSGREVIDVGSAFPMGMHTQ